MTTTKKAAKKTATRKAAAPKRAAPRKAAAAPRKTAAKTAPAAGRSRATPSARPRRPARKHLTPQEAAEHIQALLEAKQERVRQGPTWPGADEHPGGNNGHLDTGTGNGGVSSEAVYGHIRQPPERSGNN